MRVTNSHAFSAFSVGRMLACIVMAICLSACGTPLPKDTLVARKAVAGDCVVMLHGLARSRASMEPMRTALIHHGYLVVNLTYPSRSSTVEQLSDTVMPAALNGCRSQNAKRIHIVSHSMGGILVRHYLRENDVPELQRLVMLAPPNQGSQIVDKLRYLPGFKWLMGPAGMQLGTDEQSMPTSLGAVEVDTAVIAGTRSINLFLSLFLPNPDDGKVSLVNTRVEGMCAQLALPIAHPFIMKDARVITEVLTYITTGRFASESATYPDCQSRLTSDTWES